MIFALAHCIRLPRCALRRLVPDLTAIEVLALVAFTKPFAVLAVAVLTFAFPVPL
jgi:hypothetical protein